MKLIPYENFQIDTTLSFAEVLQRIKNKTGDKELFKLRQSHEFSGYVGESEFQITKNISYRNSFAPVIIGDIHPKSTGAQIKISMRLNLFVMFFMLIWFSGIGAFCVAMFSKMEQFSAPMLLPFVMLIFGLAMVSGGFWFEASKQKTRLIELLSNS